MICVTINGEEHRVDRDPDEQWIAQQIRRRRQDGQQVWVRVRIQVDGWGLILSTPNAPRDGGGGGGLNRIQSQIVDLWNGHRLNCDEAQPGELIAFLKQLRKCL